VTNATSGFLGGYIRIAGGVGTEMNAGTIKGGMILSAGGMMVNQAGALVQEYQAIGSGGTLAPTVATTIVNAGTMTGWGVHLGAGSVTNQAGGTLSGSFYGIYVAGSGSIFNSGTIQETHDNLGSGFNFPAAVKTGKTGTAYLSNAATGVVTGVDHAIFAGYQPITVVNAGSIQGPTTGFNSPSGIAISGIWLNKGGSVSNAAGGYISGISGPSGGGSPTRASVANSGRIGAVSGLYSVVNQAGGVIQYVTAYGTVENAGTIGNLNTPGAASLKLSAGARLIVDPGGRFYGVATGGGGPGSANPSTLELAPGSGFLPGIGTTLTNFATIAFDGGAAWTIEGSTAGLGAPTIVGFARGNKLDVDGFQAKYKSFSNGVLTLTNASSAQISLNIPGNFTKYSFSVYSDGVGGTDILSLACFVQGTTIATPRGDRAVETLAVGDIVAARFAGEAAIVWTGHRRIDCRAYRDPRQVWPVRVRAGAFADGAPARDLFLSPDHAVFVDDVLIPIRLLIEGTLIVQEPRDEVTYHHVELARHDVLLAEGLEAESYLDAGDKWTFSAAGAVIRLRPDMASHSVAAAVRWEAEGCARLVFAGPELQGVRRRLNARAARSGAVDLATRPVVAHAEGRIRGR
jgi:hypothetical protein